jgi:hypothetical protein
LIVAVLQILAAFANSTNPFLAIENATLTRGIDTFLDWTQLFDSFESQEKSTKGDRLRSKSYKKMTEAVQPLARPTVSATKA